MKHLIINIDTFIKDRELYVAFFVENEPLEPFITGTFQSIEKMVGNLTVFELEALTGCWLEPSSYYQKGEKMPSGSVAFDNQRFPKAYKISFDGSYEDLKARNSDKFLFFESIYKVKIGDKNSKEKYVVVITTEEKCYFSKLHVFKALVGIPENDYGLLTGAFIAPVMYKKGDFSYYNGRFIKIKEDDKIVATFNIRIEGTVDQKFERQGVPLIELNYQIQQDRFSEDYDQDEEYGNSYDEFNGYNGWDDDTINDAFDGDSEATWNVD